MRLIDADALKKAIVQMREDYIEDNFFWTKLFEAIDNAPTVEASNIIDGLNNEIDDLSENLAWYINERNRLLKERRQQGEWITIKSPLSTETVVKCPFCNDEFIGNDVEHYNFCPMCSADMRGGENE